MIQIEVTYIKNPDNQFLCRFKIKLQSKVFDAIKASGVLNLYPHLIPIEKQKIGIFYQIVNLDTVLENGDRVEIYNPLKIDPKKARRERILKLNKEKYRLII